MWALHQYWPINPTFKLFLSWTNENFTILHYSLSVTNSFVCWDLHHVRAEANDYRLSKADSLLIQADLEGNEFQISKF